MSVVLELYMWVHLWTHYTMSNVSSLYFVLLNLML